MMRCLKCNSSMMRARYLNSEDTGSLQLEVDESRELWICMYCREATKLLWTLNDTTRRPDPELLKMDMAYRGEVTGTLDNTGGLDWRAAYDKDPRILTPEMAANKKVISEVKPPIAPVKRQRKIALCDG